MLHSPRQWDKPYAAMLLIHKETKRTWCIAACHNPEYLRDTVFYGIELKEKWGLIEETIESAARNGSKFTVKELTQSFESPIPQHHEPATY